MAVVFLALWTAVAPAQEPDSAARSRVTAALQGVQDSLDRVRGAAYNFRTDLGGASGVVLYNRAQRMHASCGAADRALARLDSVLTASYPVGAPVALRREGRALRSALAACRREYDTAARWEQRADSVRAWASHRLRRLDEAVRRFALVAAQYYRPAVQRPRR